MSIIKKKKPLKLRNEFKYSINNADDYIVTQRLRKLFKHDANAGEEGIYQINSLYFDTPNDKAMRQKVDGVSRREKFRIRYYGNDLSFINIEKKLKIDRKNAKYKARLSVEEVEKILNKDYDFLLTRDNEFLHEFYSKLQGELLRPVSVVTYEREAFSYEPGNVRITVDRNLRTTLNPYHFLDLEGKLIDVEREFSIFEVKYDAYLPDIVKMAVQIPNRRSRENSKYALSRRFD